MVLMYEKDKMPETFKVVNNEGVSEIAQWYGSRNILVTGATGFLGKVLVERLLRVSPPEKLYLLLRPKKGRSVKDRLEDFLNCQVFDGLRDTYPERLKNVHAVKGDILQEELGISHQDKQELIKECDIIFHCAANVRFDQPLKGAIITNTLGTKKILTFAKEMENLDVFVHVSTAYCHCDKEILEEVSYPSMHDPEKIIDLISWMDPDILTNITPQLIGDLPNTYAYSKNLSEQLVSNHANFFPVVIARPSIVIASWRDPIPGWIENLNGPTGLLVGAGKGVIRSMHCKEDYYADIMPVDVCANILITLGWRGGTKKLKQPITCNLTQSEINPVTWGESLAIGRKHLYDNPFSLTLWYPDGSIKSSWLLHYFCVIFFHFVPAYLIDLLLILLRKKPFMVKTQKRISGGLEVLQYYTIRQWKFTNDTMKEMPSWLNERDRKVFYTDIENIDWNKYMQNYILGAREYCCKEDPATLPRARKMLKRLYYLDQITSYLFYILLLWLLWTYSVTILDSFDSVFKYFGSYVPMLGSRIEFKS